MIAAGNHFAAHAVLARLLAFGDVLRPHRHRHLCADRATIDLGPQIAEGGIDHRMTLLMADHSTVKKIGDVHETRAEDGAGPLVKLIRR